MKKKITALLLVVALVAVSIAGATMAYFTDTDQAVNVSTVGNVKIKQHEYERGENGKLQPYTQGKPAFPVVGDVAWDANGVNVNDTEYRVFDSGLKNVLDKIVTVENTGKSPAYVRTLVAIEAPGYDPDNLIHINYNDTGVDIASTIKTKIDGVEYVIFEFTYQEALPAGAHSAPSLMQYFLDSAATNEYAEKFGDTWEILVYSQAVQTAGFDDAQTALDTAFYDITVDEHPWKDTVIVSTNDEAELLSALISGKDVILNTDIVEIDNAAFDGKGTTVTLAGTGNNGGDNNYGYLAFAPGKGNDTKVENLTVTGSGFVEVGHYGEGGGTYEVKDLTVEDMIATLCINNGGNNIAAAFSHYGTATLTDCVMNGTASLKDGFKPYDAAFVNGTKTTINGGEYGTIYLANQAHVTISGAKVDVIDSYAINYKHQGKILGDLTIKSGTHVGTINLAPGSFKPALVIEEGATVGTIVYNGKTYTQNEWTYGVDTADKLIEALGNGEDVVLTESIKIDPANMSNAYGTTGINVTNGQTIDGNGHTLDIKGAGGTWDSGINTTGGLIKDLTVTGSFRGIFINHNSTYSERVVLENVTIDGTVYTISCDQGMNQGLTATNSTFNGWTSYAATIGDVKFDGCSFGEGRGYAFCRPYAPTEFVNCDFEKGFTVDPCAAVSFENCRLNGVLITAENVDDLVTSTAQVTVK